MIKELLKSGKTEEEAIKAALDELGLERDDVSVEIIDRAKSGFLGIGAVKAKVKVSYEIPDEPKPAKVKPVATEKPVKAEKPAKDERPAQSSKNTKPSAKKEPKKEAFVRQAAPAERFRGLLWEALSDAGVKHLMQYSILRIMPAAKGTTSVLTLMLMRKDIAVRERNLSSSLPKKWQRRPLNISGAWHWNR